MAWETWYVLEDGTNANPADVVVGDDGRLRHNDGRAVAYRPDGKTPHSRGVDPDEERGGGKATKPAKAAKSSKDMKPEDPPKEPKGGYKTRETKAD